MTYDVRAKLLGLLINTRPSYWVLEDSIFHEGTPLSMSEIQIAGNSEKEL